MDVSIVFVGDEKARRNLSQQLDANTFTLNSVAGLSADLVMTTLATDSVVNLIVDWQATAQLPLIAEVLRRIVRGGLRAINLITVGDQFVPLCLVESIDLLAAEHFEMNNRGEVADLDRLREILKSRTARPVPECRHIESLGFELKTYTPKFFQIVDDLVRIAGHDVTILLLGETGTGKTTLAKLIHVCSQRRGHPFQHLACGALPPDLIESELFGHVRGAFTGADRNKVGRFQAAGRGSLLLDEIDALDVNQQAKLLKVIESGEYELVGSSDPQKSEARLIVASNVSLQDMTEDGRFRHDLYYRLNVLEFYLPPLRERPNDLVALAAQFIEELAVEYGIAIRRVHRDFVKALQAYQWPGNLRELKNQLRRAVLFNSNGDLTVNELPHKIIQSQFSPPDTRPEASWKLVERVAQSEKEMLRDALAANGNNRTRTAKMLGISRVGLYKKLRRLDLIGDSVKELAPA